MKHKVIILLAIIFSINSFSQSYKNIKEYNQENTKIATFSLDTTKYIKEKILVLSRILYKNYPDIYFASVNDNGEGIVFLSKESNFSKFLDELYNDYGYTITNIKELDYSDKLFFETYIDSHFVTQDMPDNAINIVKLGVTDKDELNYNIAYKIFNKR
jgi:hypothetical protein